MWEAYELDNEDLLWAAIAFSGGIAGQQQAPCGAVSASAVCLGLRHRSVLWPRSRGLNKGGSAHVRMPASWSRASPRSLVPSSAVTCLDLTSPMPRQPVGSASRACGERSVITMFSSSSRNSTNLTGSEMLAANCYREYFAEGFSIEQIWTR